MSKWIVVLILLSWSALQFAYAQSPSAQIALQDSSRQVENLRLWHSPDSTRIVFDVSANVKHNMFTLQNPLRLVVDIENAGFSVKLPNIDPANQHVSGMRFGSPKPGVLRFVFELKKPLQGKDFVLSPNELYGHRLVVDLLDPNAEADTANLKSSSPSINTRPQGSSRASVAVPGNSPATNSSPAIKSVVRSAPAVNPNRPLIVAIDAGHGGEDPGALGYRGSREKQLTFAIASKLKAVVDRDPRMKSYMVRQGDYYIKLHKRRLMARDAGADIFISIHADAFTKQSARGFSVFALSQSGATSAMAGALAAKENASDMIGGVSLSDKDEVLAKVLVDLSMTNTISESVNVGGRVLKELAKLGKLHSKRVEQAGFAVLKSADIPSILIETGFITNPEEERNLKSSAYQTKLAKAIYTAINEYFEQTPYRSNATYASLALPNNLPQTSSVNADVPAASVYTSVVRPSAKSRSSKSSSSSSSRSSKPNPATHKVVRGDSLSKIAERYGTRVSSLKRLNNMRGNTIVLGQRIKLPSNGSSSTTAGSSGSTSVSKPLVYKVRRGDSLSRISERYNVTINSLKKANGLRKNTVYAGQKLKIPGAASSSAEPRVHKVRRGDTLSEIAERYGSTIRKIMQANSLSRNTIVLGQRLKIPN